MNTAARAWQAAMLALAEAREHHARGGGTDTLRELLRHAREMMDVIEEEVTEMRAEVADPAAIRVAAVELRKRVEALEATLPLLY